MRVPKWLWPLLAIASLAACVVAYAAANLNGYLTANREKIAERASHALGRPLRFDRLELSIGRGLGIAVRGLAVTEDPRFGTGDFLTADSAFVQIRILPALFGRYEIARIALERPAIALVRTADGVSLEKLSSRRGPSDDASSAQRQAIAIALLDIEDGTVRYVDRTRKPAREIAAADVTFHASDLSFGDALRFELSAAVLGAATANFSASGAVGPVNLQDVGATPLDVTVQLENVDGGALQAMLPSTSDLRLEGPIASKLDVGGTVDAWTLNFSLNAGAARLKYGGVFDKPRTSSLTVSGQLVRRSDDTFLANPIEVTTASSTLTIRGTIGSTSPTPTYALTLSGAGVSLGDWATSLPALRDAGVQGQADIAVDVAKSGAASSPTISGRVAMDSVEARLGDSPTATGRLSGVLIFKGRAASLTADELRIGGSPARLDARIDDVFAPVVAFKLSAPTFPIALLMETTADDTLEGVEASGRLSLAEKEVGLQAQVRANSGTVHGLPMTNFRATIVRRDGDTRVDPIAFDSCGGSLRGIVAQTAAHDTAQYPGNKIDLNVVGLSLPDLAAALTGTGAVLPASGKLSFSIAAAGAGTDWPTVSQALDGTGRFDIADGAIRGTNVPEALLEQLTGFPGLSALLPATLRTDFPALFGQKDTRFKSLAASFRIANGRLQTQDLAVKAHDFSIDAVGTLALDLGVDLAATLTASPELSSRLLSEAGAVKLLADRDGRVAIPFRLTGGLPAVKAHPDVEVLTQRLQRGLVEQLGERLLGGGAKPKPAPRQAP